MPLPEQVERGLEALLGDEAAFRRYEEELLARQRAEIERQQQDLARQINENTFARGLGLSTVTRDLQAERERIRQETLAKAAREAFIAAQQARQSALGQAAAYTTSQQARQQQAQQFRQAQRQQRQLHGEQLLGAGLAGLASGGLQTAGYIFGPSLRGRLFGDRNRVTVPPPPGTVYAASPGAPSTPPPTPSPLSPALDELAQIVPEIAPETFAAPQFELPALEGLSLPPTFFEPPPLTFGDFSPTLDFVDFPAFTPGLEDLFFNIPPEQLAL